MEENRMKLVTLTQLLENWHRFSEPITRDEIDSLGWDELMLSLGIYCPEAEDVSLEMSDVDMTTYLNPAVSFSLIE